MLSRAICFCLVIVVANAAVQRAPLPPKPKELEHKEGCYVEEVNDVIPFGEKVSDPNQCQSINCSEDLLVYHSCGVIGVDDPNCFISDPDLSKPYPDCCPTLKCKTGTHI